MSKFYPTGDNISIKRLQPIRQGSIHIPQETIQKQFYGIIQEIGDKVKDTFLQKNLIVFVSPTSRNIQRYKDLYIIKETDIIAIKHEGIVRAFGNRVLLKRLNQEKKIGSIIIPDCHNEADQSLEGILVSRGIINGKIIDIPIIGGETVRVEKWNIDIIEIDIDSEYYLSVRVKDLAYAIHS